MTETTSPTAGSDLATAADLAKVQEIATLLAEAYRHYFAGSDGYCKASEGAISLHVQPFFWDGEDAGYGKATVSIYSYVFGPSRQHHFDSVDEALATVRGWHATEMAKTRDEHGDVVTASPGPQTVRSEEHQR